MHQDVSKRIEFRPKFMPNGDWVNECAMLLCALAELAKRAGVPACWSILCDHHCSILDREPLINELYSPEPDRIIQKTNSVIQ